MKLFLSATALVLAAAAPAAAQSSFGDTQLSYQNGVVYDDDLVPGRRSNQSFLAQEQQEQSGRSSGTTVRVVRQPSRNLIGTDGRTVIVER